MLSLFDFSFRLGYVRSQSLQNAYYKIQDLAQYKFDSSARIYVLLKNISDIFLYGGQFNNFSQEIIAIVIKIFRNIIDVYILNFP